MHFRDWWLVGTIENARWGATMWDLSNQFVAEGEVGGLATFLCFLGLIYICFSRNGIARQSVKGIAQRMVFLDPRRYPLFSRRRVLWN